MHELLQKGVSGVRSDTEYGFPGDFGLGGFVLAPAGVEFPPFSLFRAHEQDTCDEPSNPSLLASR
jgi:hypothetical protein